jgi:hypothetical protein
MRIQFFSRWRVSNLACAMSVGAAVLFLIVATVPAEVNGCPDRLRILKEKIDSLEIEKQEKKRNGQSIDELEERTALLRDTVRALRLEVQQGALSLPAKTKQGVVNKILPMAGSFFDRLVLGAGAIAVLVALIIFPVIVINRGRRRRLRAAQGRPEIKKQPISADVRPSHETAVQKAYAAQMTMGPDRNSGRNNARENVPQKQVDPIDTSLSATAGPAKNLNDLVVQASRAGLDSKEISRKYQIGVDQVELIVKMAKKK